ncbi:MAG TPA: hypothetical protein VK997_00670 [Deferrisomatales bacterium]|nr:hypothetical protein [Deferrisomatales bacterium]
MGDLGRFPLPPRLHRWGVAAACATLLLFLAACSRQDETARIREWVRDGAVLAEAHDLGGLLARTTEGFRAEPGARDRDGVGEVLAAAFYHYRRFRLLYPYPAVEITADGLGAAVAVPFLLVRRDVELPDLQELQDDPQGWLAQVGDRADLYHLELQLEKREGRWLATSAHLR